ncbi:MAG TPA: helix-turn-helix domain-containing GNAT family N-acetyltransferase [Burkholderiales bacterium]|nr:helix-turn-helix domain-containing GNAT family N-acetyltransferase [Burkholderiales bacterium]
MSRIDAGISTLRAFNRCYTRRIGVLQSKYLGTPFPLPQARVLYELGHRGECTASALGADLDLDLGYLSRLLQGLKRQRLVQGEPAKHDARQVRLTLSPKGRKAFAALDESSRRATGEMLAPLPPARRQRLVDALQAAHAVLEPQAAKGRITLRAHRPGDMGWVIQAHGAIYEAEFGWGVRFEALVAEIAARFLRDFDAKRERCWIAEMDGAPVGSVFVVKESQTVAKLRLLILEPHARGQGLGTRLVAECIAFSRRAGYKKLVLWTQSNLYAARAIYAAAGFKKIKSAPHREFGIPLTGEYWELVL